MMRSHQDDIFKQDLQDGVDYLPRGPGMYCILNRVTGKLYVGQAGNIYKRCQQHRNELRRGLSSNFLMRRDAEVNGMNAFFFVLRLDGLTESPRPFEVDKIEVWLSVQLRSHDERYGYNLEAGHRRTTGAMFRDSERKLMRGNSRKYMLLPWVNLYDPIHPTLLAHWIRSS